MFLYALRREVLRNRCRPKAWRSNAYPVACFYTPFGVRCFGTGTEPSGPYGALEFLYALRREVLRNIEAGAVSFNNRRAASFYTPFGVRCFGTLPPWTGR